MEEKIGHDMTHPIFQNNQHTNNKPNIKTISGRKYAVESMENIKEFNNKIVLIGCGGVGTALIPLLFKFIKINPTNLIVIDMESTRFDNLTKFINQGIQTFNVNLEKKL